MKIVLLTQDAPVYLAPFLNDFFIRLASTEHEMVAVVSLPPFFKKSRVAEIRERVDFYGVPAFIQMAGYIVYNKVLAMLGKPTAVSDVLQKHGIPRREVLNVNKPDFIEWMQANKIDLLVSVAFPKILKQPLLDTPSKGCINYHTGMLPKYRGRQPLFWALYHSEPEVGITVHEMDAGIDNGAILVQERIPVAPSDSLHDLYIKTTSQGAGVLMRAVEMVASGDSMRLPNDASQASYFTFPTTEEARHFRKSGKRFF